MVITVDYHQLSDGSITSISVGSSDSLISALQSTVGVPITGIYDDLTTAAVENFQIRKDLEPTGEVDEITFSKLFPPMAIPEPTTIFTRPNVTVSGDLSDKITIKLCQTMLQYIPTGYLDNDTRDSLVLRGYDLDTSEGVTVLQNDLNSGKLVEVENTEPTS